MAIGLRGIGRELAKDCPAAVIATREALGIFSSLSPESDEVAICLSQIGNSLALLGQFDEVESSYREALVIASALADQEGLATYTGNLAEMALDREQWPEAEGLARQALELAEEVDRKELIANNCRQLAKALARQHRGGEGRSHAERAVAIYTDLRSPNLAEAQAALAECQPQ